MDRYTKHARILLELRQKMDDTAVLFIYILQRVAFLSSVIFFTKSSTPPFGTTPSTPARGLYPQPSSTFPASAIRMHCMRIHSLTSMEGYRCTYRSQNPLQKGMGCRPIRTISPRTCGATHFLGKPTGQVHLCLCIIVITIRFYHYVPIFHAVVFDLAISVNTVAGSCCIFTA